MTTRSRGSTLVTGSTGLIGRAAIRSLLSSGHDVIAVVRASRTDLGIDAGRSDGLRLVEGDLSTVESTRALIHELERQGSEVGCLIGLAAGDVIGEVGSFSDEELHTALCVKLVSHVLIAQWAVESHMAPQGYGRVILASGITGHEPVRRYLVGAIINAAVRVAVKALAETWGGTGVTVNALCPGPVRSPRFDAVQDQVSTSPSRNPWMRGPEGVPRGTYLAPEEVVNVITFLMSDSSSGISGTEILVDGGASLGT